MPQQVETLEGTALHEAGHAVMAWFCDHIIGVVSIIPDYDDNSAGHVLSDDKGCNSLFEPFELHPYPEAPGGWVVRLGETEARPLTDNEQRCLELQEEIQVLPRAERCAMVYAAGEVVERIANPGITEWPGAQDDWAKAAEHLDILASDEGIDVGQAKARVIDRSEALLKEPIVWAAVEAVANALLEHEKMDGKAVVEVIRSAFQSDTSSE